ncbi:MAG: MarR family transcriptional regulator [Desulfobacterales bacterium]|nr:MAG: MarR family transcriptional regulator [Desulfobacterales bacterium]
MKEITEKMIYDMAFRVRLYIASKLSEENRVRDLSDREALILELIDTKGSMSISEISNFYPKVSNSTISTTVTKLWKEKKLVDKYILPENQRITTVSLTDEGRQVLGQIKRSQADIFNTVSKSLGLSVNQNESFRQILKSAISFFDDLLGLRLNGHNSLIS